MQYMLMFYQPQSEFEQRGQAEGQAYMSGWMSYIGAIRESGIAVNGHGLTPPMTGTTLRVRGDKRQVQDGPFADTKEQLGGYFVIEVPNLDTALEWAARAPCASTGGVEVRPVFTAPT
ncbi:MAG TPA: YciI family protein [Variovorax sp.]